jgi:hypothetical protein
MLWLLSALFLIPLFPLHAKSRCRFLELEVLEDRRVPSVTVPASPNPGTLQAEVTQMSKTKPILRLEIDYVDIAVQNLAEDVVMFQTDTNQLNGLQSRAVPTRHAQEVALQARIKLYELFVKRDRETSDNDELSLKRAQTRLGKSSNPEIANYVATTAENQALVDTEATGGVLNTTQVFVAMPGGDFYDTGTDSVYLYLGEGDYENSETGEVWLDEGGGNLFNPTTRVTYINVTGGYIDLSNGAYIPVLNSAAQQLSNQ